MDRLTSARVIWITGLSGAGKSTLAQAIASRLRERGEAVILLDGDELREVLKATTEGQLHYGRDERVELSLTYSRLCRMLVSQGLTVVIATISLFREVHFWNRCHLPGYYEVYLKVPIEELRKRDAKGIYRRFDAGELSNVAGLDLPVDEPIEADWIIENAPEHSLSELTEKFLLRIINRG